MSEKIDACCADERQDSTCCAEGAKTLVLACAGGSNVGQVANNVMLGVDRQGYGNAYCLAGVGAALSGFIESAKAGRTILIDGCPVACGKKAFEKYGIEPAKYFVVTELGITKNHDFSQLEQETQAAMDSIVSKL
ncbi:MAG TPA: zinc-binding protein [Deltaproteobacteria bacterium]|nr:zinc-binding protein [Deltaproteobacteria bacterium]